MKRTFLIIIFALIGFTVQAQQSMFNLNYSMAVPMGDSKDFVGNSSFRGGTFEGRGFINDQLSVGGYLGWNIFNETRVGEEYSGPGLDVKGTQYRFLNMIPMQVTTHYYLGDFEGVTAYGGIGVGATRSLQRTEIGLIAVTNNNWHLGISPEIGVYIPLNFNVGFNVSARYDHAVKSNDYTYSNLTFNIGFSFLDY